LGEEATPPLPAPRPLRRLLGFAKLPDQALAAVARVVDADEEFRGRVAAVAQEEDVGRAGWLYLTRPDGWEIELGALTDSAGAAAQVAADEHEERQARRRLRGAEEARRQAERALADARAALARTADELETERQLRRQAEMRMAAAEAERDRWRTAAERAPGPPREDRSEPDAARRAADARAEAIAASRAAAAAAVGRAEAAVQAVEAALADAAAALEVADDGGGAPVVESEAARGTAAAGRPADLSAGLAADPAGVLTPPGRGAAPPARRRPVRQPVPLPPGVFEDSAEAAEHLVRYPGAVVLVDGYNVGFVAWPQLPVPEVRRRLVDALGELAARTGADIQVVFDGADGVDGVPRAGSGRSQVRVRFSLPEVEADEVIIGLAGSLPAGRAVVVATNDRRVQDEVRRLGARTLSSGQFLGVLGRARGG
jgi:predicted RNA-binding protein with PIN domain